MIGEPLTGDAIGFRHIHFPTIGSTNTYLIEEFSNGEPGGLWATSDVQTAGKGSRGRNWTSDVGNLYASLILENPSPISAFGQLSFVAALAARKAIQSFAEDAQATIMLKWPNDVILNNGKCGGILLEGGTLMSRNYVTIGMGLNCNYYPSDTVFPATSMSREGLEVEPSALFPKLANAMACKIAVWDRGAGFEKIRSEWLEYAYGLGEDAEVEVPTRGKLKGQFASIDEQGYMLLKMQTGNEEKISVADVFFKRRS